MTLEMIGIAFGVRINNSGGETRRSREYRLLRSLISMQTLRFCCQSVVVDNPKSTRDHHPSMNHVNVTVRSHQDVDNGKMLEIKEDNGSIRGRASDCLATKHWAFASKST